MIRKLLFLFVCLITSISLTAQTICVNATEQLVGTGNPALVDPWISSDAAVASVDANGLVLGVSPGTCTVTYTDEFAVTTDFNITVEAPTDPTITLVSAVGTDGQTLQFDQIISGDYYYDPLVDIVYQTQPGVSISMHPSSTFPLGVSYTIVGNTLTISGTPYTDNPITNPITFSYTILSDGTNSCTGLGVGFPVSSTSTVSGSIILAVPCESSISGYDYSEYWCTGGMISSSLQLLNDATSVTVSTFSGNYSQVGNTINFSLYLLGPGSASMTITTNGHCLNNTRIISINEIMSYANIDVTSNNQNQTICPGDNIAPIVFNYYEFLSSPVLPSGLFITYNGGNTATISGTPLDAGVLNFSLNSYSQFCGKTDLENISITVLAAPATPTISSDGPTTLCQGESVNLTSSSVTDNTWSTASNAQTINVNSSGTYTVSVSNGTCSATSDPLLVTVNPQPIISLGNTLNPTGCGNSDGEIEILGNGSGTLSWTGTSSGSLVTSLPINLNTFPAGVYDFTFDEGCISNSISATLIETSSPTIPTVTTNGPLTFCEGDSVVLTASTASNIEWSNSEISQFITIHNSGSYFVTVTENGCSATSAIIVVDVTASPSAPVITNSGPSTFCIGESVNLSTNISSGIVWSPTNETSQSITVANSGDYFLTLTENGCSVNSDTISIFVNSIIPSIPTISVIGNLTFCEGDSVVLTSSSLDNNSWSNNISNQTIVAYNSGIFTVSVNENGCVVTSDPIEVVEIPLPNIPFISANGPTTFCTGSSLTLISSSMNNNTWSTGSVNQSINVTSSGEYFVTVDTLGCSVISDPIFVTVNLTPQTPIILADGSFTFCEGGSVNLSTTYTSNIEWSTSQTTTNINVNNSDVITVTVTINGCSSTSNPIVVTENVNPTPVLDAVNDICNTGSIFGLTNGLPAGGNYTVNGVSTTTFNPAIENLGANTIVYTLIDGNGCTGSTIGNITVVNCLSIEEESQTVFTVYPNPSSGVFYLKSENLESVRSVILHDALGRIVNVYFDITEVTIFDLSEYAEGMYTISIKGDDFENIQKVQVIK